MDQLWGGMGWTDGIIYVGLLVVRALLVVLIPVTYTPLLLPRLLHYNDCC